VIAETVSRMKSKLPACFFISSRYARRQFIAPTRSASSFLLGEVVKRHVSSELTCHFTTSPNKKEDALRVGADETVVSRNADEMKKHAGSLISFSTPFPPITISTRISICSASTGILRSSVLRQSLSMCLRLV